MSDTNIQCPHCQEWFRLDETLAAPIVAETRRVLEREFHKKEEALAERLKTFAEDQQAAENSRKELAKERAALTKQREEIAEAIAEQVEEQRAAIVRDQAKKAKQKYDQRLAQLDEEKVELEALIKDKETKLTEARKQEADLRRKERELDDKMRAADVEVEKRVSAALAPEREKARKEAEEQLKLQITELANTVDNQKQQLEESHKQEAEFRRKERELDDKLRGADVEVEKRVSAALTPEREKARKEAEEQQRLKMAEKDKLIADMQRQVADLKRKAEQGSEQLQGEVQELDLEKVLVARFPQDSIERVPRANTAVMFCNEFMASWASHAVRFSGSLSAPKTGAMAGWRSCDPIKEQRRLR